MRPEGKRVFTPKLRFPEFRDAPRWTEKPLEEILSPIVRERNKPVDAYTGLGIRSHGKGTFLRSLENPEKNSMEYLYEVHGDDLIVNITFAWEGAIAIANPSDTGALVSHRFPTFVFKRDAASPEFFRYIILDKQFVYKLGVISPGGAGRNRVLNKNDFLKLRVILPQISEQQRVADFLTNLDELIAAHGHKLDALKTHRRGLMQQLFPCEGETLPRLRFPEFENSPHWISDSLGNIFETSSGGTPERSVKGYWNGDIPWVTTSLVDFNVIYSSDEFITEMGLGNSSAKRFPKKTVLVAMYGQGKTRGKVALLGIEATTNQACAAILPREDIDPYFVFLNLAGRYDEMRALSNSGGQENLSQGLIKGLPFSYPNDVAEQQSISACLSSLDDLITAQTQKVEALRIHKQGLIQQLFPSREEAL